jgi:hypothetical protein
MGRPQESPHQGHIDTVVIASVDGLPAKAFVKDLRSRAALGVQVKNMVA